MIKLGKDMHRSPLRPPDGFHAPIILETVLVSLAGLGEPGRRKRPALESA
jgi:hypothetical protein